MRCPMMAAILCVMMEGVALAQAPLLVPGQRVRVALREGPTCGQLGLGTGNPVLATMTAVSPNDVTFRSLADPGKGSEWVVPRDSICRVEVSRGVHRNGWRGAAVGAIVGAGVGGVLGAVECTVESGSGSESCKTGALSGAVYGGLIGAAVFALAGAGLGALIRTERWEQVPPDALRVSVVPMVDTRRAGLALRLQF